MKKSIAAAILAAGPAVTLLAVNVTFEAERQGDNTSLSAKLGLRF